MVEQLVEALRTDLGQSLQKRLADDVTAADQLVIGFVNEFEHMPASVPDHHEAGGLLKKLPEAVLLRLDPPFGLHSLRRFHDDGENAAGGYGLTAAIAREFFDAGVDLVTLGNHAWDQRDIIGIMDSEPRIVRPLNMAGVPGRGIGELRSPRGRRIIVLQVLGRLFMGLYDLLAVRWMQQRCLRYRLRTPKSSA